MAVTGSADVADTPPAWSGEGEDGVVDTGDATVIKGRRAQRGREVCSLGGFKPSGDTEIANAALPKDISDFPDCV